MKSVQAEYQYPAADSNNNNNNKVIYIAPIPLRLLIII